MTFAVTSVLDLPDEWTNKFDLVHQHLLIGALKYDAWAVAIKEIFRVIKPGGLVELCESIPFKLDSGPRSRRYMDAFRQIAKHYNMDFDIVHRIPDLLLQAGFVEIHTEVKIVNFGPAGGADGHRFSLTHAGIARGFWGPLMVAGGLGVAQSEEWKALIDEAKEEWESEGESNAEYPWYIFTAKKLA